MSYLSYCILNSLKPYPNEIVWPNPKLTLMAALKSCRSYMIRLPNEKDWRSRDPLLGSLAFEPLDRHRFYTGNTCLIKHFAVSVKLK